MLTIQIHNQHLVLHHYGVIFWKEKKILLIADVHLGKIAHFRKNGFAVPVILQEVNYKKLDEVVSLFNPEKIFFLGDLFHSNKNSDFENFSLWVKKNNSAIFLIEGNHDIINKISFEKLTVKFVDNLIIDTFYFAHIPEVKEGYFTFSGHIHPAILLKGLGKQKLKLPCFYLQEKQLILPAFGTFTGTHLINPKENELVFVIAEDEVKKI